MLSIMSDAILDADSIQEDAKPRFKMTDYAVKRGLRRYRVDSVDDLAGELGYKRLAFYRIRTGKCPTRLSDAFRLSEKLGLPITRIFERV